VVASVWLGCSGWLVCSVWFVCSVVLVCSAWLVGSAWLVASAWLVCSGSLVGSLWLCCAVVLGWLADASVPPLAAPGSDWPAEPAWGVSAELWGDDAAAGCGVALLPAAEDAFERSPEVLA